MAGGLNGPDPSAPFKPHRLIFEQETSQAVDELRRPAIGLLASGAIAGAAIGIGAFAAAAVAAHAADVPGLYLRLLLSSALAVGFIIAIMGRTDVFTEYTTIAIFPVLIGTAPLGSLLRLWAYVYASNVVGAAAFGMLAARLALELQLFDRAAAAMLVEGLAGHPYWVLGISAFVAGWLMGLLSWLITAGRDTISQVFFIGIVTGLIGFAHLHHCVSWTAEGALALSLGAVTLQEVARVLVWATLGNAAGGVVFAVMVRYGALLGDDDKRGRDRDRREDSAQLRHGSGSTDERSE